MNIIGYGYVGSAFGYLCEQNGIDYNVYDVTVKVGVFTYFSCLKEMIDETDCKEGSAFYVIAVPTPSNSDGSCDFSILLSVLEQLNLYCKKQDSYVIVKSTVVPTTMSKLRQFYNRLQLIFCPEFLRELTYKEDMYNAKFVLCGCEIGTREVIKGFFMRLYVHNPALEIIFRSYEECEMFKYSLNVFFAVKIWYFNEIYELCEKVGICYDRVRELYRLDERVGNYGTKVPGDDGFGFAKSCLPKETRGMICLQDQFGIDCDVLKGVMRRNCYFRLKPL